jgi:prevent-host-death family protein
MKKIQATAFKAHCYAIIKEVQVTAEPIIVTKRGKPVVKIVPADPEPSDLFGFMAGKLKIVGDIEGPVWTERKSRAKRRSLKRRRSRMA